MLPFYQVDAFSTQFFHGNTAGVVLLDRGLSEETMLNIARQNNLPATAFIRVVNEGTFLIRWFTPTRELPLCGHATLAAAFILFSKDTARNHLVLQSKKERLTICRNQEWIEMDFPAFPLQQEALPPELRETFPDGVLFCGRTQNRLLVQLQTEEEVREFHGDEKQLKNHRLILTARSHPGKDYDFVSRYFAYPDGVGEDAVTGSAHCSLVPFWASRLGKSELHAFQVSQRGGELRLSFRGDRVSIAGKAVKVMEGNILI